MSENKKMAGNIIDGAEKYANDFGNGKVDKITLLRAVAAESRNSDNLEKIGQMGVECAKGEHGTGNVAALTDAIKSEARKAMNIIPADAMNIDPAEVCNAIGKRPYNKAAAVR